MPRFSFRSRPDDIELSDELRAGFELKIAEYRGRLKMLRRDGPGRLSVPNLDDGIFIARSKDEIHSFYKMEIMQRLLRDGKASFDQIQADVREVSQTHFFNPTVFRSAYQVVMDYCLGRHELPQASEKVG